MGNFLLGIFSALIMIFLVQSIIDNSIGKFSNVVNSAVLDCVEQGIITPDQAHEICEMMNKKGREL